MREKTNLKHSKKYNHIVHENHADENMVITISYTFLLAKMFKSMHNINGK